jgi:hypothetical protein
LEAIKDAGKYVALDISSGVVPGTGTEFDPGAYNTGEKYIVRLVLPGAAESVTAGTLDNPAFKNFTALKEVSGAHIETIGDYTFSDCTALTEASFPAVTTIGTYAIGGCTALTTVSFPAAASIGYGAFGGCTALITASFPAATFLSNFAFAECTALTSVSFSAVTTITHAAFAGCTALTTVNLPASLTTFTPTAFFGCTNLTNIIVDEGNPSFKHSADKRMLLNKADTSLAVYPSAASVITVDGITAIGGSAFEGYTALTEASFPAVTFISRFAFRGCTALIEVSFPAATSINSGVFYDTGPTPLTLPLPQTAPTVFDYDTSHTTYSKTVTIKTPSGRIGYDAEWETDFKKAFGENATITLVFKDL